MRVKRKLFLTTAFAALLGVGAFAGVSSTKAASKAVEVEAAGNATFYLIKNYGWSNIRIHYWGGSSSSSWDSRPSMVDTGVDATRSGQTGRVYKYDIPSDTTGIIVTGTENGDKQTKDYTSWNPSGNNAAYFSSWDGSANKAVLGSCSYKNTNPSSTKKQFYVYDPHSLLGSFANVTVYGFGETDTYKPMTFPGIHDGITQTTLGGRSIYSVNLSETYPSFIMSNTSSSYQTADLTITGNTGKVLVIENDGDTHWIAASQFTSDVPASDGYYIVDGTHSFSGAPRMTDTTGDNQAECIGYSASAGDVLNIRSCFLDSANPKTVGAYGGGETPFGHADANNNFVFTKNATVNIYAKWVDSSLKFYLASRNVFDGYYMVGDAAFIAEFGTSGSAYSLESGVHMNATTGGNKAVYTFTNSTTITFKARYFDDSGNHWVSNTEKSSEATSHGASFDGSGNYVVPAGTWSLYIFEKNSADASSLTWGMPLDSYTAEFMSLTGPACAASDVSALASAWSTLSTDWSKLSSTDQNTLKTATASQTGTDVQKVMARYDVIIHNHSSFSDYMGRKSQANYSYRASIRMLESIQSSASTIIIVAISATCLAAIGGYFLFKKKKEN